MCAPLLLGLIATTTATVTFSPPSPRLGDLAVVHVRGLPPGEAELHAFGHATALDLIGRGQRRGFVPVPVDTTPGDAEVRVVVDGAVVLKASLPVARRDFERSELRVSRRFTKKKPPKVRRRIARESRQLARVWAAAPTEPLAFGEARRPVSGRRTSPFGVQRVFNGKTKSTHYGLDLDGRTGDPVRALWPGRVVLSSRRYYSGGTIVLDHGSGLFSLYFHLSKRRTKPGATLEAGARLGDVGKTGRVTGPHLHLAVVVAVRELTGERKGRTRSMYVDPEPLLGMALPPPS